MNSDTPSIDLINLSLSLSFSPVISFGGGPGIVTQTPVNEPGTEGGRFRADMDIRLQYEPLTRLLNGYLAGKKIDLSEGLLATHIVIRRVSLSGTEGGRLRLEASFTGSFNGALTILGTPVYNDTTKTIVLLSPQYDLQTKNILLRGAKILFASRIEKELKKAANFSIRTYLENARQALSAQLNREWTKGVQGTGEMNALEVKDLRALPDYLVMQARCEGKLKITISELVIPLKNG